MIRLEPFWLNMSISESAAPVCAEKARLLRLCALAESHHQRTIREPARFIGKLKKSDFEELLEFGRPQARSWQQRRKRWNGTVPSTDVDDREAGLGK
jgi:hypothetical protein